MLVHPSNNDFVTVDGDSVSEKYVEPMGSSAHEDLLCDDVYLRVKMVSASDSCSSDSGMRHFRMRIKSMPCANRSPTEDDERRASETSLAHLSEKAPGMP